MLLSQVQDAQQAKTARANVLIVEDERVSRRALAALMSASGFETEAAGSAEEALHAVAAGVHPDIALVDLDLLAPPLPGMTALVFTAQLTPLAPEVSPGLITPATGDNPTSMLQQRGVAYLRKPLDFDRLMNLLGAKEPN